jgi:hypothetical protein
MNSTRFNFRAIRQSMNEFPCSASIVCSSRDEIRAQSVGWQNIPHSSFTFFNRRPDLNFFL